MKSKKVKLTHPLVQMGFSFFVYEDATPEELLETLEVYAKQFLDQQKIMKNPFRWSDELRMLQKGRRLIEVSPSLHSQLLKQCREIK